MVPIVLPGMLAAIVAAPARNRSHVSITVYKPASIPASLPAARTELTATSVLANGMYVCCFSCVVY